MRKLAAAWGETRVTLV
jgi:hypothetical protein